MPAAADSTRPQGRGPLRHRVGWGADGGDVAILATVAALALLGIVLWEVFETIVLPRRVDRALRLTRLFYRYTWAAWKLPVGGMSGGSASDQYLAFYGPLSLLFLVVFWAVALIFGFALLHWGLSSREAAPEGTPGFGALLYFSGTTFFTLGFGDIVPRDPLGRAV